MAQGNHDNAPPSSEVLALCLTVVILTVTIAVLPILVSDMFVRDIYGPLTHGDPVVRVNYTYFALPAVLLGGISLWIMFTAGVVVRLLRQPIQHIMPLARGCLRTAIVSVVLLVVFPLTGGLLTEQYARSRGYDYCAKLFELGVATYSRGYVNDPRLCVRYYAVEEALARHGYEDALRRYRFGASGS